MEFGKATTKVKHKLGSTDGKISVDYEFPIYADFEEFVAAAGTPEAGMAFVSAAVKKEAGAKVRETITEAPEVGTTEAAIVERAQEAGKSFQPIPSATNKEKANELDTILAMVRSEGPAAVAENLLALASRLQ